MDKDTTDCPLLASYEGRMMSSGLMTPKLT